MSYSQMNIRKQENRLFAEWESGREGFVRDGVVSEKDYLESQPKIAFVLKEVNDLGGGGWDLREYIAEGGRAQTWDNIARWTDAIKNRENIPDWESYRKISNEFRIEVLKSVVALNLKKSPGTHTTDVASLVSVAEEDKELIRKQFSLYDPDLTICGGTGDLFKLVVGHQNCAWESTKRGIWWYERDSGKFVISYAHPEARIQNSILVYSLLDAVNEILDY